MDLNDCPMVRVIWHDAQEQSAGWMDAQAMSESPLATVEEVGILVLVNDERVVVSRSRVLEDLDEGSTGGACIAIPRDWVQSIELLVPAGLLEPSDR
jgi:hypothetical protein